MFYKKNMEILKSYIKPSYSRKPFYDGAEGESYKFNCPHCNTKNEISFSQLLKSAWGWEKSMSELDVLAIKNHFGIGIVNKSHDGGWPSINLIECKSCKKELLSYIGFHEYRNSVYKVTEQGLSSVKT